MSSRAVHTTCATVDRFCVTNLVFHYHIKILKLRHPHACASVDIMFLYWYRDSKFHINILVYGYTYITHPYFLIVNRIRG